MTDVATDQPKPKQYRGFAVIKDKNPELHRDLSSRGGVARAEQRADEPATTPAVRPAGRPASVENRLEPRAPTQAGRVLYRTVEAEWRWWHYLPFTPYPKDELFRIDITAGGFVGLRRASPDEVEASGFSG